MAYRNEDILHSSRFWWTASKSKYPSVNYALIESLHFAVVIAWLKHNIGLKLSADSNKFDKASIVSNNCIQIIAVIKYEWLSVGVHFSSASNKECWLKAMAIFGRQLYNVNICSRLRTGNSWRESGEYGMKCLHSWKWSELWYVAVLPTE